MHRSLAIVLASRLAEERDTAARVAVASRSLVVLTDAD